MSFVPLVPRRCTWQDLEPVLGARSVPRRISDVCRTSCAGPWEHAGAMLIGASIGAGLAALNESEKAKFDERQKVQRLRNAGLLPIPSAGGGDAEEAGGDEDY